MFRKEAAETLSVVADKTCTFAAYCDGRSTFEVERVYDERIVARVDGVVVGIYDRWQLENDRDVVDDIAARVEAVIRAQNEKPADTDGQSADL